MIDLTTVNHHPAIEEIVDVLCNKTQNTDRGFFRTEVAYFLAKIASCMRTVVVTKDRGEIPVNLYALALSTSGFGKGHSVSVMENEFIKGFRTEFMSITMPLIAEGNLWDLAQVRAKNKGSEPDGEFERLEKEYQRAGTFAFTFDSGTPAALKQLRHKLLLAGCGAINMQIDEIGSHLIGATDMLNVFLELYDQGQVKQKITKNTAENERAEEIEGKTPTNALLFGTPSTLLDGGPTEEQFYNFLDTGYARRCLFGFGQHNRKAFNTQTAAEIYARLIQPQNNVAIDKWSDHFASLAHASKFGFKVTMPDDVAVELLQYKIDCEQAADKLPDHKEINKAELSHRYFKVLKLSGAFSFVDEQTDLSMENLHRAIKLVEDSGVAFQLILNRKKSYVKLAEYIADVETEVTHADLHEALPFYKSTASARNEMMLMAVAWGYKKHIIIKKNFVDGIEFFRGEKLKETDLDKMLLSYSEHFAYDFMPEEVPFDQLHIVTQASGFHWANHAFKNNHRAEENVLAGFNMVVIDVDGGTSIASVKELFTDYKYLIYTTKRHTDEENRFRLILPINYSLELDSEEYKEFMTNVVAWLPFKVDESANQRARKWLSFEGEYHYNPEGELLDALPFIPKTSKNEQYKQGMKAVESYDNLERWFAIRIASGNRNNQMLKYALALVDSGLELLEVGKRVHSFNSKLNTPLSETEIDTTILNTVAKRFSRK